LSYWARCWCARGYGNDIGSKAGTSATASVAKLETSRIAANRRRGMRAVYADGVVEIDFLTRKMRNTTRRRLNALELGGSLGESVAAFVKAVQTNSAALVRPEEARRALQTALLVDEAAEFSGDIACQMQYAAYA